MKLFYSPDYVAAAESSDTMRKSGWIAESLVVDPVDGVEIVAPRSVTFDEVAVVHDPAYVAAMSGRSGSTRRLTGPVTGAWSTTRGGPTA